MPFHLRQETLDGHAQQSRPAEAGHVAEDVRRIEPLPGDVKLEQFDEPSGDLMHGPGGQVVVDEEFAMAFEGSLAEFVDAGPEIEGELHIGPKEEGLDRLGIGPVEGLLEEKQPGDGVKFLGGPAVGGVEMLAEGFGRHEFEEHGPKDRRPAVVELLAGERRKDAGKGVKQRDLSGIDGMAHVTSNSIADKEL